MPGKANCCCPARVQYSVLCPRFRGEDGSEDLPVRFGRPALAGAVLVDAVVGADVVAAGESFSTDKPVSATRGPTSGSLALMSGSGPLSGDANESLPVAAKELGVYLYMLTGGEPLVRKADILRLAKKHNDVQFAIYTNSTQKNII